MFNLNQEIANWRRQMSTEGTITPTILDELESHVREDFANLRQADMQEAQAFKVAVSRIGNLAPLRTEFDKVKSDSCLPATIVSWLWLGAMIVLALFLVWVLFKGNPVLLIAHIFSVTAGYYTVFQIGILGICYACYRSINTLSPAREQSLGRAALLFSHLATGLAVVGFILGMLWSRQAYGHYLGNNPREIGMLIACIWLVALSTIQQFHRVSNHVAMLLCIGGNIVVGLAWFGAGIISSNPAMPAYGIGRYWLLDAFVGLHLMFIMIGLLPVREAKEA